MHFGKRRVLTILQTSLNNCSLILQKSNGSFLAVGCEISLYKRVVLRHFLPELVLVLLEIASDGLFFETHYSLLFGVSIFSFEHLVALLGL